MFQRVLCFCRERPRPWSTQRLHVLVSPHFSDFSVTESFTKQTHDSIRLYCVQPVSHLKKEKKKKNKKQCHFHRVMIQEPRRLISIAKADRCNSKQSYENPTPAFFPPSSSFKDIISYRQQGFFSPSFLPGIFFPPKISSALEFDLWMVICVHQGSHLSLCADKIRLWTHFCR